MICQRCKGKGWAIVLVKQKEGFYHTEQAKCPECHGKGFVEQTNEEWLKEEKDTNQFACKMCELFEIRCTDCKFYDKSMRIGGCTLPSWLKEVHQ